MTNSSLFFYYVGLISSWVVLPLLIVASCFSYRKTKKNIHLLVIAVSFVMFLLKFAGFNEGKAGGFVLMGYLVCFIVLPLGAFQIYFWKNRLRKK
ncbi:MAG: hypothetical protein FJZ56_06505 [Chlamydiae bacterium]|nr:hypothetical protein [Chlamydiota bacterium]